MKPNRVVALVFALLLGAVLVHAQGGPDFSKIEIKSNKIADNFYTLEGQGGTIGVLVGPDGVFMVDTQFAPLSEKIASAIKQLTPQPIKFVVNTHVHGDHTGGDANFGKMGATIISREELRYRLAYPNPQANGQPGVPMAAEGLPKQTYRDRLTMHMNGQEIQLIAIPRACLVAVSPAGVNRLLWVRVQTNRPDWDLMGAVAHELWHVIEVLGRPDIRNNAAMYLFYDVNGRRTSTGFETKEAIRVGDRVRREVRRPGGRIEPRELASLQ